MTTIRISAINLIDRIAVFPPDTRRYQVVTPSNERRRFACCLATAAIEGQSGRCNYRVGLDHHKTMVAKGNLHTCNFQPIKRPLDDLMRRNQEMESGVWNHVANLPASQNLSIQTAT
jgi:hypothetical protein